MRRSSICHKAAALASCLLPFAGAALALDPNRAMSQYIRDRWGADRGFPNGPVYAITQTPDGYLWIGAEAGVIRFDGVTFRSMPGAERYSSPGAALGLTPDAEGNLWVRLLGPMMLRYRDGAFSNPMVELGYSNVSAMARTNRGGVLAAAMDHGAITHRDGRFEMLASAANLPRSPVIAIAQTPSGEIWMGTRDAGLFRVAGGQSTAIVKGLPDPKVNCLLSVGDREIWIGTDSGIARWDGAQIVRDAATALDGIQVLALANDRDGNIWVGTDSRGLLRLNANGVVDLPSLGFDRSAAVTAVFEDRERNLWIGTARGLERLRDSAFVTFSTAEGLPSENAGPIYTDDAGRVWFAPPTGGLHRLLDGKVDRITSAGLANDIVYSISGGGNDVWVGRQRGGLTRLSEQGTSTYTNRQGLVKDGIYAVHRARDGTIWAAGLTAGLSRFKDGQFTTFTTDDGLASNSVLAILESADRSMWFATPAGLNSLTVDQWRRYTTDDGLPSAAVNCLFEDSAGVLWAGTSKGLAFRRDGRFHPPPGGSDALRAPIFGIAQDAEGALWVTTPNRVIRVKRDTPVREYGVADGLHSTEGVKRHKSVAADRQGRIWLSLTRGLSMVDPRRLPSGAAPAIVHIQSVSADGEDLGANPELRLRQQPRRVAFTFTGLSLSVPERIRFRYRLEGFDRDWSEPSAAREAVYTNLPPRSYRFRVVASNAEGVWNGAEAILGLQVEPKLWQRWWIQTAALLVCALAGLAVWRYRLRQITAQLNVRFEERLAERTRIAQELHDTLLQGCMGASMQLQVAAARLPEESPARQPVDRILGLMAGLVDEGRNAIRGIRLEDCGGEDLARAFSGIRHEVGGADDVDFRVTLDGSPRPLHPVVRDDVYRLGREALANAFRRPGTGRVEMQLEYSRRRLRILVRDDGEGTDPGTRDAGAPNNVSLAKMRAQAERIGARLDVRSSPASGTAVELSVPSHVAFRCGPVAPPRWWPRRGNRGETTEMTSGEN